MSMAEAKNRRKPATLWRFLVCFLLAGLFLYNPFLEGHRANGTLTICHPTRHRATVGSCELEQLAQRGGMAAPLPDLVVMPGFLDLRPATPSPRRLTARFVPSSPPAAGFFSSLWFRPPPTV